MDNLKFLKENISELQRLTKSVLTHSYDNLQKDEILKFMSLYEIILFININTNVKKCNTSEEFIFINIYDNYEEIQGYFKKEIAPSISILYNDFSVYYFDEHTEAEFMTEETYSYRSALYDFLKSQDKEKANEYLQSLKEYIKQHKTQEREMVKYIRHSLENSQKDLNNLDEIYKELFEYEDKEYAQRFIKKYYNRQSLEKSCLKKKQELKFYEDALSNNKDTI